jgi:chorismate mutase
LQKQHVMTSVSLNILPLSAWVPMHNDRLFIAGPCSIESRQQLFETAEKIAAGKMVSVLRAGVWKPRSRPGHFEGKGKKALPWLQEVKQQTGLMTAVEVAQPAHAELCLEYGVDILWLGARTSVNPFMVQEIANAIRGTGIPVMIKNPVCPDLSLWIGAIERIALAGITKLIAVHRGFKTHQKSSSRNIPLWDIPLALKRMIPGIPIVCDPSHIAGQRYGIAGVAENALALGMDGLMIEAHHKPEEALTDSRQQITPEVLHDMLQHLLNKKPYNEPAKKLQSLRSLIDEKDHQLLELIAERLSLAKEIGYIKKETQTPVIQSERQNDILMDRLRRGKSLGLDELFIKHLIELLHRESVKTQENAGQCADE